MNSFELEIFDGRINRVLVEREEVNIDDIEDEGLLEKINNVSKWLKLHSLKKYYMDNKEYEDYKEFIILKQYLVDTSGVVNPLKEKAKKAGVKIYE